MAEEPKTLEQHLASYVPAHVVFELLASPELKPPNAPERQDFEGLTSSGHAATPKPTLVTTVALCPWIAPASAICDDDDEGW